MHRFLLRENIRLYKEILASLSEGPERDRLNQVLAKAECELEELEKLSVDSSLAIDSLLHKDIERVLQAAMDHSRATFGNVQLYDPVSKSLRILAQRNLPLSFLRHFEIVTVADGSACARCLDHDRQMAIEDVYSDAEYRDHLEIARLTGYRAVQSIPLHDSGNFIGVVSLLFRDVRAFPLEVDDNLQRYCRTLAAMLTRQVQTPRV